MALSRMCKASEICFSRNPSLFKNFYDRPKGNIRTFRKQRPPEDGKASLETPFVGDAGVVPNLHVSKLVQPFLFTLGFSFSCFVGVTIWEYERMRSHAIEMLKKPSKLFKRSPDSNQSSWIKDLKKQWQSLSAGERVFVPICVINLLVFGAWKVPRFQPFMLKYFCSNPGSKNVCLPMILSTFSHYSGFHLFANMYVLHSFSTGAVHSLGKEQFLGLYLTGGVVSSFTSYVYKVITKQPGLSLGASGAIMAVLGYVCTQYPETKLGIILLPIFTFSAGSAIKGIVALDTAGVLLKWKFFDHAAHLGGAAFGIFWALWGHQYVWQKREPILQYWHKMRGSIK